EYQLNPSDKRLQFLQKLRDEAHRFAITFHQKQKQKTMRQTQIMELEGIGKATQKKLLAYFGDFQSIYEADLEELKKVVDSKKALIIHTLKNQKDSQLT
ncbi:MAG: excinuclease ABC subunit C, partial [Helicobacter sp.]|nr:excinuclease ABC subunit C [Helicobacter sp.]